jgi:hypothetical protein
MGQNGFTWVNNILPNTRIAADEHPASIDQTNVASICSVNVRNGPGASAVAMMNCRTLPPSL